MDPLYDAKSFGAVGPRYDAERPGAVLFHVSIRKYEFLAELATMALNCLALYGHYRMPRLTKHFDAQLSQYNCLIMYSRTYCFCFT